MHVAIVRDPKTVRAPAAGHQKSQRVSGDRAQAIAEELIESGHHAEVFEDDARLLETLGDFMPARNGCATGIVFNLVRGADGDCRAVQIAAALEVAGVPCTGPTPLGHALTSDVTVVGALLRAAGIPAPQRTIVAWPQDTARALVLPLVVRAQWYQASWQPRVVTTPRELVDAIDELSATGGQVVVEDFVEGMRISVGLVGNGRDLETLPPIQRTDNGLVPAAFGERVAATVRNLAAAAFDACRCQDYARIDLRVTDDGDAVVVGVDAMPSLATGGSYAMAAAAGGYTRGTLVERIVDAASTRCFGVPAPRFDVTWPPAR